MKLFNTTNSQFHSVEITGLVNNLTITKYILCQDKDKNTRSFSHDFYVNYRTELPPLLQPIPDKIINENETLIITLNASDPENDPLFVTIEDVQSIDYPDKIADKFSIAGLTLSLSTNFDDDGVYKLKVSVDDNSAIVSDEFILTVNNRNRPPDVNIADVLNSFEDIYYNYTINAVDLDGDPLMYLDNTTLFNVNTYTGEISFNPKQENVGTYSIELNVSDGQLTTSKIISFIVNPVNDAPIVQFIYPQFASINEKFSLQVEAYDPDGDLLSYNDNSTLFNINGTGYIEFTPVLANSGTHLISIEASDSYVSSSQLLNLVITGNNSLPVIKSITDEIYVHPNETANIIVDACDPDIFAGCV